VMGMSHAGGEGWMGTRRPLPTTLGAVVEQGAQPLYSLAQVWLRGHPTILSVHADGSTLLTGGVEGAHQRKASRVDELEHLAPRVVCSRGGR